MAVISKLDLNGKNITKYNNSLITNIKFNGVDHHFAKAREITNGICENSVNEPIRDMRIGGNTLQDKYGTINIFNPTLITAVRSSPNITNPYGTTINSLSYNGNSIVVTQTVYSDDVSYEGYYGNGVFYIEFDKKDVLAGVTYTLIADINITNNLGNKELLRIISQGGTLKSIPIINGKIIVSFSQAEADRNLVEIRCNGMSFVLSNIMLLKGEYTEAPDYVPVTTKPEPNYPIGYKSVGDKTVNLFNVFNAIQQSNYIDRVKLNNDGSLTIYQPTGSSVSDYTTLKQFAPSLEVGKTYVLNFETTGTITASNQIWILDSKQTWKRGTSRTIIETDLTSPIFWYGDGAGQTITISQIQITEGTETKEYEPYGYKIAVKANNKITNIYLNEPLKKVGDYADYIDYKNKKVVRNVGTKTFNGSENWSSYMFGSTNTYLVDVGEMIKGTRQPFLSNIFETNLYYSSSQQPNNTITFGYVTSHIYVKYDSVSNLEEFKTFLANNNLKITFGLAAPTEETFRADEIWTFDGETTMSVETEIKPSEFTVNYWKQIGVVEPEILPDEITQDGSSILIISTGATITQSGSILTIGE